jgi:hypothetical protein
VNTTNKWEAWVLQVDLQLTLELFSKSRSSRIHMVDNRYKRSIIHRISCLTSVFSEEAPMLTRLSQQDNSQTNCLIIEKNEQRLKHKLVQLQQKNSSQGMSELQSLYKADKISIFRLISLSKN